MIRRWIRCARWWLKYRFLNLKPGDKIVITYPNSSISAELLKHADCNCEVVRAWWERPRYAIDPHVPDLGIVFLGGWQLHVRYYDTLFGVIKQCRDSVHIRRRDA